MMKSLVKYSIWAKSLILIMGLSLSFSNFCYSQYHYKGEKGLEISWGKSDIGYLFKGGYSKYFKDNWYYKGLVFYEFGRPFQTNYQNFGFEALACFSPFNINDDVFFNLSGGVTGNYEYILDLNLSNKSSFNEGFIIGAEGEFFVNEQVAFIGGAFQNILLNSKFGNHRWNFDIGLKFMIR